jgi:hypothetical protein
MSSKLSVLQRLHVKMTTDGRIYEDDDFLIFPDGGVVLRHGTSVIETTTTALRGLYTGSKKHYVILGTLGVGDPSTTARPYPPPGLSGRTDLMGMEDIEKLIDVDPSLSTEHTKLTKDKEGVHEVKLAEDSLKEFVPGVTENEPLTATPAEPVGAQFTDVEGVSPTHEGGRRTKPLSFADALALVQNKLALVVNPHDGTRKFQDVDSIAGIPTREYQSAANQPPSQGGYG